MANVISTVNSFSYSLASGDNHTCQSEIVSAYSSVTIALRGSSPIPGTLYIGFSADGTTWTETAYPIANPMSQAPISVVIGNVYYRLRYVNGSGAQSYFRLQSTFVVNPTAGSQGPPGPQGPQGPAGPAGPGSITEYREVFTLGTIDMVSKSVTLAHTPLTPANTELTPWGFLRQRYSIDFTVVSNVVSWSGLGLDGVLQQGDTIEVRYLA